MPVFLVATKHPSEEMNAALESRFPDDVLRIADNQWLVSAPLSTGKFSESVDPGEGGSLGEWIVVTAGNYSGWHDFDTWEWINQKRSESRRG